jgi:hypothetical protein
MKQKLGMIEHRLKIADLRYLVAKHAQDNG